MTVRADMAETDVPLLNVAEVAELLNVSERWVYDSVVRSRNPLPSVKVGHFRRFRKSEILAWLEEQQP